MRCKAARGLTAAYAGRSPAFQETVSCPCGFNPTLAPELPAFPIQCLLHPTDILRRRPDETKVADLQRNHLERGDSPCGGDVGEVHQD